MVIRLRAGKRPLVKKSVKDTIMRLNKVIDRLGELQLRKREANMVLAAVEHDPELRAAADKVIETMPTCQLVEEEEGELIAEKERFMDLLKAHARTRTAALHCGGWSLSSRAGGTKKEFDHDKAVKFLEKAGLDDLKVGGRPIIRTVSTVDPDVWTAAVESKKLDEDEAIEAKVVEIITKTRSAYVKPLKEDDNE